VDFAPFLGWGLDVFFIIFIDTARGIRHGIAAHAFSLSRNNINYTYFSLSIIFIIRCFDGSA
jgi:hypothetical protein